MDDVENVKFCLGKKEEFFLQPQKKGQKWISRVLQVPLENEQAIFTHKIPLKAAVVLSEQNVHRNEP